MITKDEALKMAIKEIEGWIDHAYGHSPEECADNKTIMACKEALEQPAQEPDRTGMVYYKNNACKAKDAKSPDCICWTPEKPTQEPVAWTYEALGWMEREGIDLANELADKHIAGDDSGVFNIKLREALRQLSMTVYSQSQKIVELVIKDTHPHQWQSLTDDEIEAIMMKPFVYFEFARAIEQALRSKSGY